MLDTTAAEVRPAPAMAPLPALADALLADAGALQGPNAGLYDGLLGSWDVDVVDVLPDGALLRQRGEWHFARVLEGRAIQDVFIVPARDRRSAAPPAAGNRYGTTLRVYDARLDAWTVDWTNPVTGARNHLLGRGRGAAIEQLGSDGDRQLRWTFTELAADSFRWTGESSTDGGRTWRLEVEFHARRRGAAPR